MSDTQPKHPAPLEGRASWLDYVLDPCQVPMAGEVAHARAELAELRELLSVYKETADVENAQWEKRHSEARKALAEAQGKLAIATANAAELAQQRDSLRTQVAELRGAILGLGELTGTEVHAGWGPTLRVHLSPSNVQGFNALVSRLRAEAPGEDPKR